MDADATFLRPAQEAFSHPEYLRTGTLFFRDRVLKVKKASQREWARSVLPPDEADWIPELRNNPILQRNSRHVQEAAVVVIDKRRALPGLIGTCLLNDHQHRSVSYSQVYGDKDTFWLGMAMANLSYGLNAAPVGQVGVADAARSYVCGGSLLHLTHDARPFWINGGFGLKVRPAPPLYRVEAYASEPGTWFTYERGFDCLYVEEGAVQLMNEEELGVVRDLTALWVAALDEYKRAGGEVVVIGLVGILDHLQEIYFVFVQAYCFLFRRCIEPY
jgi:hypothetical protein